MAGQMDQLLVEVSSKLEATAAMLKDTRRWMENMNHDYVEVAQRLAKLEEAKTWEGDERRKVDGRLGSGDQTFLRIDAQIKQAHAAAVSAAKLAAAASRAAAIAHDAADKAAGTKKRTRFWKIAEVVFPIAWPVFTAAVSWLFYHLMFLAKLAEQAKAHGVHP